MEMVHEVVKASEVKATSFREHTDTGRRCEKHEGKLGCAKLFEGKKCGNRIVHVPMRHRETFILISIILDS